jgi:hypothetical protein
MQFVTYMKAGIEGLKVFMPLLSAIKGKGLEKRHFAQIEKETGIDINLQKMNLKDLKSMGIHFGALLEKVKMISEGATRENQIKQTLEQLEAEVYNAAITILPYKDTYGLVVKGIDDYLMTLEEAEIKNAAMINSTFSRYYKDRMDRLERDIKDLIVFYSTWKSLQKLWAYLMPIFNQKDMNL